MKDKVKLRVTITWTFEAKPEYYGPEINTPEKMAAVEQGQENIEAMLAIGMEQDDFEFTVKPERERRGSGGMIVIHGQPISKKNSINLVDIGKQCPYCKRRVKSIPLPSKAFKTYEKSAEAQFRLVKQSYRGAVEISAQYWLQTARRPDLNNLLAATADILQAIGIIEDDKNIVSWDGSRIMGKDTVNPRVEIEIKEIP